MKRNHGSLQLVAALVCTIMIPFIMWAQEGEAKESHVLPSGFAIKLERMGGYLGSYSVFWIYPDGQVINGLGETGKIPSEIVVQWLETTTPYVTPPLSGAAKEFPMMGPICHDCSSYLITIYAKDGNRVRIFPGSNAEMTKTYPEIINRLQRLTWSPLMGEPEDPDMPRRKPEAPPLPPRRNLRQPINVDGNVQASKPIRKVELVYPELAKRARVAETIILVITVDEEGNVTDLKVQKGHPLLNPAAIDAVKQWKYSPTLLNGEPVPVSFAVTVIYSFTASGETAISVGGKHI
jgi:TonB family protein